MWAFLHLKETDFYFYNKDQKKVYAANQ